MSNPRAVRFVVLALALLAGSGRLHAAEMPPTANAADTAWMLISTALVLLMTPALAFFYGGLVRSKSALNTMMMSVASMGVVGLLWALLDYSLAFGPGTALVGDTSMWALTGVGLQNAPNTSIPHLLFMGYQGTFAIITAALISGALVERMRFPAYLLFIALRSVVVYAPVAHWVWGGGFLGAGHLGALDFAGGTVVHINAGIAALVSALVLGQRRDYGRQAFLPHNVPFVLLGAGLLWFGWFGFNGGSALAASPLAALAFINTLLAPAATLVTWTLLDYARTGRITAVGTATGIVIGLVAITPAAGFISPMSSILLGILAAFPSYFLILWRSRSGLDDSLDVFAAHGTGGIVGALLTGLLAEKAWGGTDGLLFGNPAQLLVQLEAVAITALYSGAATFVLLRIVDRIVPLRVEHRDERYGLDITQHGEEAYTTGEGAVLLIPGEPGTSPTRTSPSTPGGPHEADHRDRAHRQAE